MKTVSARIRSATAELTEMGEEVDDIVQSTSKYRAEIKSLSGVDIMSDETTYKSVYQILKEIATVYDDLSDINKAQLIEDLAGKRNAQVIASIITNLNDLTGSYEAANNAAGTLATANDVYLNSIEGKMNQLSTAYEKFSTNILSSGLVKTVVDIAKGAINLLNGIDEMTDGVSTSVVELVAFGAVLSAIIKTLSATTVFVRAGENIIKLGTSIRGAAGAAVPAFKMAEGAALSFSASLGWIGAAAIAITGLVVAVKAFAGNLHTFSNLKKELKETRTSIDDIDAELADIQSRLEELNAIENPTLADEEEIRKLKKENEQLQIKLDLFRAQEEEQAEEAEEKWVSSNSRKYRENGNTGAIAGYQAYLNKLNLYETQMDRASLLHDQGEHEEAFQWEEIAAENLARATEIYQELEGEVTDSGITGLTEEGKEILDTVTEMAVRLTALKGLGSGAASSIRALFGEFKYGELNDAVARMGSTPESVQQGLQQLWDSIAEGGNLTPAQEQLKLLIDTIMELFQIDYSAGGESFLELANILLGLGDAAEATSEQLATISYETIDAAKAKVDTVNDAMKDFEKYGGLTQDTVKSLTSTFPALRDALYDTNGRLTDAGKAALASQSAMAAFAKTAMATYKGINGMTLEEAKKELEELRKKYAEVASTAAAASVVIRGTSVKVSGPTAYIDGGGRDIGDKVTRDNIVQMESAIKSYEDMMAEFNASLQASFTSSSSSSTDKFKQGLEKQLKILKHQLEMERITYEEYYAGVAKIRDQYQAKDASKYQEEIWDLEKEIFQGRLTTFEDFVNDYNTIAENRFNAGEVTAARTTYDQILDETKRMIDWGVAYGLSENGDFMQTVRKQWKDTCSAIMDMIDDVYDEYESYADTFDLWGSGTGKVGFSQSDYYEKWLKDLKAAYDKGLMEYADYVKKHNEIAGKLYDTQRSAMEEIINMTIDMLKQESEDMVDALDEQVEKYQELIELKRKLLQETNDELDHEEEVAELVADIAELQSKIAQLSLDDSREAAAKREELEQELAEKQKELQRTQRDYALDQTLEALDEEEEAFEEEKESEKEILEDSIDDWMTLYREAIQMLESDWGGMYSKLQAYNDKYCTSIDGIDSIKTAWENVDAVVKQLGYDIEAVLNNGSNLGISPTNPMGGDLVNNVTDEAAVEAIVKQMAINRDAWVAASGNPAEQKRLSEENLRLGNSLANYGLKVVRDEPTGVWYIDHIGGEKLFDRYKYHHGGVAGDQPTGSDREILALLERGELVLDERKKNALDEMFKRIAEAANHAAAIRFTSPVGNDVDAGNVFAPHVEVNISHNGQMTEEDARRYGDVAADAALEKLRVAFNRRGL